MLYITRRHESKHSTIQEFNVARYLPYEAGKLLYYLVTPLSPEDSVYLNLCNT